jgi:hypothetical protein
MRMNTIRFGLRAASATAFALLLGACASNAPQTEALPPATALQAGPCCGPITPAGHRLIVVLDSMDVEHRWPKDQAIEWDTGLPVGPTGSEGHDPDTHCSAFTAAVGKRIGVYMPHPPMYSQIRLSEAQLSYFDSRAGRDDGWRRVDTPEQAQALANQGMLVIVGRMGHTSKYDPRPGHIAVVRPSERTEAQISESGVQMTQAGTHNWRSITAKGGFHHEPGQLPSNLEYFAHDVPDSADSAVPSSE